MTHRYARRSFSIMLCIIMLLICIIVPAANAATTKKSTATFTCLTMNDRTFWARTSKVTFTNTGCNGSLTIKPSASGCSVSPASKTIGMGKSCTFTIKTPWGNTGTTKFYVQNTWGCPITYSLSSSNTEMILRSDK